VSQLVGDLTTGAPPRRLADVILPVSIALLSLSPLADPVDLSDDAFDNAEGVLGLGSFSLTDAPPACSGFEQLVRRYCGYQSLGILISSTGSVISPTGRAPKG
jgi:hypothetical protein